MSQTVDLVEVRITREDYLLSLATTKSWNLHVIENKIEFCESKSNE
jgi:hypothetical protein